MAPDQKVPDATIPRQASDRKSAAAPLCLLVVSANCPHTLPLPAELVIGRDQSADLIVPDGGVSRRHARLVGTGSRYELTDLGSTNGTFVNGSPICSVMLEPGDRIEIGNFVAKLLPGDDPEVILQNQLRDRLERDTLTGALNRSALDSELAGLEQSGQPFAVVLMDLDKFKSVNDTYGHPVGDEVLCEAVARLTDVTESQALLARYGGEEFAILVSCEQAAAQAVAIATAARTTLSSNPCQTTAGPLPITASFGVAESISGESAAACLARADVALYQSKRAGRNRVTLSDSSSA